MGKSKVNNCDNCYWVQECKSGGEYKFSLECFTPNEQVTTYQDIRYTKVNLYYTRHENKKNEREWGDE